MLLLASAFFLTLLRCSNAQNKAGITPADCNTIEEDAGVALDLVNKHRRDGYVFGLFQVVDAHELHTGNSSILYLTLDVLETECSVLSRKHWDSCEYSDTYPMDFGQCKIITHTNHLLKKAKLYGFNCTLSPVPPDLLECKDCPVKIEVLEVTEQHKDIAAKALKKFNSESNQTNYFTVDKVERILKMTASREGHILGFSIKETKCSKSMQQADQALECDFLHDCHAQVGFCKARIITDADELDGTDISCEIYQPWQHGYGRRGKFSPHRHPHFHHHFGHRHFHRHHHRHECPPPSQLRPEDPESKHNFRKENQDSHDRLAPPSSPPPHDEPDHHHLPHHHGPHCPPPLHPHGPDHHHPHYPHPHHHGPHCPPPPHPHGPDHHHPHHPHPHHHGPHCPPPPHPHGPDHHHPHHPHHHGPHCPPLPSPHGPDHHHPPHHHGPHCPPPPGHSPHHCHRYYRHHCNKTSMSGKYFPSHMVGTVYRIPVLNKQDSLTPPTANFPELTLDNSYSSSTEEGIPFTGSEVSGFPDPSIQSKSCPGKPKLVLPKILPLFPQSSMAETSPI